MSSEVGLLARGLGKRFDMFANTASALVKQFVDIRPQQEKWALRGVDLDIGPGTCLGIIGRNGSGKSTLLSVIAGIQKPTDGRLEIRGRVAALLELGAGFHPDFTGRENVRMSAAIYGLPERTLLDRLPLIEEFAGIGDFIDRPVREYSSGMYARLAFAVAAHVDADILIVDEILGVGDVRFQQRCAQFIRDFRSRGIVLLVSHSEETILALCDEAIWLSDGKVLAQGAPRAVARAYHAAMQLEASDSDEEFTVASPPVAPGVTAAVIDHAPGDWAFDLLPASGTGGRIDTVEIVSNGRQISSTSGGERLLLRVQYAAEAFTRAAIGFVFRDRVGTAVLGGDSSEFPDGQALAPEGRVEFAFELPFMPTGDYTLDVALVDLATGTPRCLARLPDAATLHVLSRHISSGMGSVAQQTAVFLVDGVAVSP